jgi:hypothetical protein
MDRLPLSRGSRDSSSGSCSRQGTLEAARDRVRASSYPTIRLRLDRLIEKVRLIDEHTQAGRSSCGCGCSTPDGRLDDETFRALPRRAPARGSLGMSAAAGSSRWRSPSWLSSRPARSQSPRSRFGCRRRLGVDAAAERRGRRWQRPRDRDDAGGSVPAREARRVGLGTVGYTIRARSVHGRRRPGYLEMWSAFADGSRYFSQDARRRTARWRALTGTAGLAARSSCRSLSRARPGRIASRSTWSCPAPARSR